MKNIIDRYLYDVSRRLPEYMRADVERELRSNIEDMLTDNPSDDEIEKVLLELGSPSKLAVQYNPHPRYLVSPELFDDYFMVLKIVAITLAALLAALAVFKIIFGDVGSISVESVIGTIVTVITSFISAAFTGIIQAFFWVTVIFFLVEYFGRKKGIPPWSPKQLPEVPKNSKVILKPSDTIANAIFTILFSTLFLVGTIRHPQFIAWYEAGTPRVPLLNEQIVLQFLPLFIFMMAFMLIITVLKLIKGRWSVSIALAQVLYSIFNAVIGATFISRPDVFTEAFVVRFAEKMNVTTATMSGYFRTGVTVIIVLIVLGAFGEIVSAISKSAKSYK